MFTEKRAGYFKVNLSGALEYKSFCPSALPLSEPLSIDGEMARLLIEAHKRLAVLDERAQYIPNMELFISMYVQKEALLSSQIEGTQATLEDIFEPTKDDNINLNVEEVVNYVKATDYALERLKELPLCNRLLLDTHRILISGIRGQEKNPGEFRKSQNWIGGSGSTLKNAVYIPPNQEDMKTFLYNLEVYMNAEDKEDLLIKSALIHYQFETIHPFLDGNGRIGRLLIVLFLLEKKVISTPAIYLSFYLKQNRIEYYDRMSEVRRTGNYEQWVKFFLEGIIFSCEDAIEVSKQLINLRNIQTEQINDSKYTIKAKKSIFKLFDYITKHPIFDITMAAKNLNLSYNTVASAVSKLVDLGIIEQFNRQARNRVYIYKDYVEILKTGTE
ncbi:MAG: filamentation induced by cAMP protein fic [Clostridiales bacterium]|nr:MAG: filamentation induced by cAMP protein fic [Clostridiales bacterium]